MYNPACAYQFVIHIELWNKEGAYTLPKFVHKGGRMTRFSEGLLRGWCGHNLGH